MKLENLQRANDLSAMKDATRRYIRQNEEALEYIEKYSNSSGIYPFGIDKSLTTATSCTDTTQFIKSVGIVTKYSYPSDHYIEAQLPLDLLCTAIKSEIKRLNARLEEIDKEIATL